MTYLKILLLIIPTFISAFALSQNAYNKIIIDKSDGIIEEHYPMGGIASQYQVLNGKIHGERRTFYRSGSVSNIEFYESGSLHGATIGFNRKGDTTSLEIYKHDTLIFFKQYFYQFNHKLKSTTETSFVEDSTLRINPFNISHGGIRHVKVSHQDVIDSTNNHNITRRFYSNGQTKSVSRFFNDYNHGVQVSYYRTGKVHVRSNYIENQLSGLFQEYYKSGIIRFEWNYLDDELNGSYLEYDKNGEVITNYIYKNGELVK